MKPPVETIRISQRSKEILTRMKVKSGIDHWNILCRWAFCISLKGSTQPTRGTPPPESNVEMTWKTFAGSMSASLISAHRVSLILSGITPTDELLSANFNAHLERGISKLQATKSLEDLFRFTNEE
jgi:DNA sulfur modification protein DndE